MYPISIGWKKINPKIKYKLNKNIILIKKLLKILKFLISYSLYKKPQLKINKLISRKKMLNTKENGMDRIKNFVIKIIILNLKLSFK